MSLEELIELCRTGNKTLEEYKDIRDIVSKEYDDFSEEEKIILGDALEELEMAIEWLE